MVAEFRGYYDSDSEWCFVVLLLVCALTNGVGACKLGCM